MTINRMIEKLEDIKAEIEEKKDTIQEKIDEIEERKWDRDLYKTEEEKIEELEEKQYKLDNILEQYIEYAIDELGEL